MMEKRGLEEGGAVQRYVDTKCLQYCQPLVPKRENILIESGKKVGSGQLEYRTPYARRWYYMPANFHEGTGHGMNSTGRGNYWFERMKQQYKEKILKGAQKIANGET
jgi:hypothetical protein